MSERGQKMAISVSAAELLPAWLEPDNDSIPPEALRKIYGRLPIEVTQVCERARASMRDAYVDGILAVHKVLAPLALFKEWCVAAGLNYRTAQSIVARAERAEREKQEQASETATQTRSLAGEDSEGGGDDEAVEPEHKPTDKPHSQHPYSDKTMGKLVLHFQPAGEKDRVVECLQAIMKVQRCESREEALTYLCDQYEAGALASAA
jgi:hypothetical protein